MKIRLITLTIKSPLNSTPRALRDLILEDLKDYGSPLRWAITSVTPHCLESDIREFGVEAVVILS